MFGRAITLGKIFGITIRIDYSWFIAFALLSISLSRGYFPGAYQFDWLTNLFLGIITACFFFVSVLLHELSHSVVGNRYGAKIKRITLFIFGGVAELEVEPSSAGVEFKMAVVGPLSSFALGLLSYLLLTLTKNLSGPLQLQAVFGALTFFNFTVGVFNLLPGYPLDGGRVLRAIVWGVKKDLLAATRIAAYGGKILAALMIFSGLGLFFLGDTLSGLWLAMIGFFLNFATVVSVTQTRFRGILSQVKVGDLMTKNAVDVGSELTMEQVFEFYISRHKLSGFPVMRAGRLVGMVYLEKLASKGPIHKQTRVDQVMTKLTKRQAVSKESRVLDALTIMAKNSLPSLPVFEEKMLVGIISQTDINYFLDVKSIILD